MQDNVQWLVFGRLSMIQSNKQSTFPIRRLFQVLRQCELGRYQLSN